jgi:hypothetical protein
MSPTEESGRLRAQQWNITRNAMFGPRLDLYEAFLVSSSTEMREIDFDARVLLQDPGSASVPWTDDGDILVK